MIRTKLLYAALVISLAVFYVLYIDSLPLIMLLCVLIVPIFLKIALLWLHFTASSELCVQCGGSRVGDSVPVTLMVDSRCPFSFPRAVADLTVRHSFSDKYEKMQIRFPLPARNVTRLSFYIHTDRCGIVELRIKRIRVFDVFGLLQTRLRSTVPSATVLVLPTPLSLPLQDEAPPVDHPDSERFSGKPGDDPSEVFGIREYRPGDQVSRMHWKLSSRSEEMLVKDFSAPICKNTLLYIEYHPVKELREAEVLLQYCYSIAAELIEGGYICDIAWSDKGKLQLHSPGTPEMLDAVFASLYTSLYTLQTDPDNARLTFAAQPYSSAVLLTNAPDPALVHLLEHELQANRKSLLCISKNAPDLLTEETAVHHISPADPALPYLMI